ncbi:MAG: nucleotidyltransferase family protein [Bacteroidales bacterium]|nr:nucleotidyltransferase family protein [Bacteroidales bacterium]
MEIKPKKAMIFAAGLGTRLGSATRDMPKALVEINGYPLLEIVLRKLEKFAYTDVVINVHHFADKIIDFAAHYKGNINLHISDESSQLLDTGGGLFKASHFFGDEPFLLHNCDVMSNIDIDRMLSQHLDNKAIATLAVRDRFTSRYFLFSKDYILSGWKNFTTGQEIITRQQDEYIPMAFSGIHMINPKIFQLYKAEKPKFSTTEMYLELSKKHEIKAYVDIADYWSDVGKPDDLKEAEKYFHKFFV